MSAPFAIEWRRKSRRTKSGWTKWQHWSVSPSREAAEESIARPWLQDWMREDEGEMRIVDRRAVT